MSDPSRNTFKIALFFLQITLESCQAVMLFLFSIVWHFTMERHTSEQRLQIIKLYYENSRSVRNVFRALCSTYGQQNRPTEHTIRNTITHLESEHSLLDNIRLNRPRPARSEKKYSGRS